MDQPDNTTRQEHRPRHRQGGRGRGRGRPSGADLGAASNAQRSPDTPTHDARPPPRSQRHPPRPEQPSGEPAPSRPPRPSRRERFRATLTEAPEAQTQNQPPPAEKPQPKPRRQPREPPGDDLTSTLTHALRTPPFADCSICFNPIRPEQATWSCSPLTSFPGGTVDDKDAEGSHCCWNTFHLKCIRAWAEKSVKDLQEAWRARGELRPGEWRCPGCRATRQAVPHIYMYAPLSSVVSYHSFTGRDTGAFVYGCATQRRRASPRRIPVHNRVRACARRANMLVRCRVIQDRVRRVR